MTDSGSSLWSIRSERSILSIGSKGSILSIADNDVLFALIGTTYGGDGQQTFALPDLRGRAAVGRVV